MNKTLTIKINKGRDTYGGHRLASQYTPITLGHSGLALRHSGLAFHHTHKKEREEARGRVMRVVGE